MSDQLFSTIPDRETAECVIAWEIVRSIYLYDRTNLLRNGEEGIKALANSYVSIRDIIIGKNKTIEVNLKDS